MTKWGSFQVCMSGLTFEVNQFNPSHQQAKEEKPYDCIDTEKAFEKKKSNTNS